MDPVRTLERAVSFAADRAWPLIQRLSALGPAPSPFHPKWSDKPIPRGKERSRPTLGWPRETDSLCPTCIKEARAEILGGEADWTKLITDNPGEIRARILEKDGRIVMEKTCPAHGSFEDVISIDPKFLARIEDLFGGRDVAMTPDNIHNHGSSTIRYGRGAVLTVDLTNRCNMMCDPCFMDANQVGYVHEPTFEDTKDRKSVV